MTFIRLIGITAALAGLAFLVSTQVSSPPDRQATAVLVDTNLPDYQLGFVSRDEFDMRLAELQILRSQVEDLSRRVTELQSQGQILSSHTPESSTIDNYDSGEVINYSVADRFEYGDQSSQGSSSNSSNLEGIIYASVSSDVEVYSTECRGALCKVYASPTTQEDNGIESSGEFIANITDSLDGNVNIYFEDEGGQQVIYVESVE